MAGLKDVPHEASFSDSVQTCVASAIALTHVRVRKKLNGFSIPKVGVAALVAADMRSVPRSLRALSPVKRSCAAACRQSENLEMRKWTTSGAIVFAAMAA